MSIPNKHSHILNDSQHTVDSNARLSRFSDAWKKTSMGTIGSVYGGLSGKNKADFEGGNARYVTFRGILENVILDDHNTASVHVRSGESQNSVLKGDLLFNASSETPGDLAIGAVMGQQLDNLYLNSFCFGFRIHDKKEYLPLFLAYYFRGSVGRDIMNVLAQGSTRYNMSKGQFFALELSIPPWAEQHAIAEVLSDVDGLIGALDALIAKKRAIKQAAMQQLLTGRIRLPGFSGEWETNQIGDVVSLCSEKNNLGTDIPVLTCSKHLGFVDSLSYFKNQVFSKDLSSYKIIRRGQIGYPINHVEEGSIGLQDLYDVALVSPIYVVCSPKEGINSFFLHRLLKLDSYRQQFANATTSSINRRGSLRWPAFSKIRVALPPIDEQVVIAAVLSDMDAEIGALEQRWDKTRAIKQGMMQQLLTGRVRLVRPDVGPQCD